MSPGSRCWVRLSSRDRGITLDRGVEPAVELVRGPRGRVEDLDLDIGAVTGRGYGVRKRRELDAAVADHRTVGRDVAARRRPVGEMEPGEPIAGARDLALDERVPEDVVDVADHADRRR